MLKVYCKRTLRNVCRYVLHRVTATSIRDLPRRSKRRSLRVCGSERDGSVIVAVTDDGGGGGSDGGGG